MSIASHYHAHKPNVPIIMEDVFGWVREGNAFQVRVWLDDTEHDLNIGDDHAFSLLHWAAKEGHATIVDMLLARGARVNVTNMGDDTPLHLAASHGHRPIVLKLINRKADVNPTNEHGMTPLHYACFWGYEQIAEDLIRAGAVLMMSNKRGKAPIDVATRSFRQYIESVAIDCGQDVSRRQPFRDDTWKGTKTRTRDATLSRYTGVDMRSLQLGKVIAQSHTGTLMRGRWQDYDVLGKVIAQSHTGTLMRGRWQDYDVVARILNVREVTPRISRDFQTEFPALRIFAHANINPVLACCNQPPDLIVISQFMPYGSLYNVLHEQSELVIDHTQAMKFAVDVARGMNFLHSLDPLIHRYYLSSKHVVVDEELSAKISMADTKFSFQEVGRMYSPAWMSPEALQKDPKHSNIRASDMWSFGILLWELCTREVPFSDLSPMEAGMKIALEGLRVTIPPGISRNMSRLINICLNEDPGRRPNFDQIIPILDRMTQ
uniref:Protein kinase domain-containing protein n=1 Tax=Steinernema glaseri TaxID=37863 RepID=A0A1I7Z721_9BILA